MLDVMNLHMLPIVQDSVNRLEYTDGVVSNISNGYYGYQASRGKSEGTNTKGSYVQTCECDMDIDYDKNSTLKKCESDYSHFASRKRAREQTNDYYEFKKRREHEPTPTSSQQSVQPKPPSIRKPLHSFPDMPRCLMGHYI